MGEEEESSSSVQVFFLYISFQYEYCWFQDGTATLPLPMILNHFQFRLVMVGHLTAGTSRRLPFITFHSSKLNWPFNNFCLNRKIKVFEKKDICHLFLFLFFLQAQIERHRKHSMRICAKVLDARRERWSIFNKTLTFPSTNVWKFGYWLWASIVHRQISF